MTEEMDLSGELLGLSFNSDAVDGNMNQVTSSVKSSYKYRKLEGKLKKYESILHKLENINCVTGDSQVPFFI